jgi:hypothetical protein
MQAVGHGELQEIRHIEVDVGALLAKGRDGHGQHGLHLLQAAHHLA